MLNNHLIHVESLNEQIARVDEEITARASVDEDVRLLLSLTGVSIYTALLIKSEIGNIGRFPNYKKLVSWAGLAPSPVASIGFGGVSRQHNQAGIQDAKVDNGGVSEGSVRP